MILGRKKALILSPAKQKILREMKELVQSSNGASLSRFAKRQQHKGFSRTRDAELSDSSPISVQSELTQSSRITPKEDVDPSLVYVNHHRFDGLADSETSSTEAKIVIDILRKLKTKVLNSPGVFDVQSKKLLYTLTEMAVEMLQTVPEENDRIAELLVAKTRIVCAFCFLCIAAATVMILVLSGSGSQSSSGGLTPT